MYCLRARDVFALSVSWPGTVCVLDSFIPSVARCLFHLSPLHTRDMWKRIAFCILMGKQGTASGSHASWRLGFWVNKNTTVSFTPKLKPMSIVGGLVLIPVVWLTRLTQLSPTNRRNHPGYHDVTAEGSGDRGKERIEQGACSCALATSGHVA